MSQSHPFPYSIKRHGTTLETCDAEPVQTPGCIQAHGILLVLRAADLTILQVGENSAQLLGLPPEKLLGNRLDRFLGPERIRALRDLASGGAAERTSFYLFTLAGGEIGNSEPLQASLHTVDGLWLLELEPDSGNVETDYYTLMRRSLARFQSAGNVRELAGFVTEEIRRETGLDRVMVYFFHADDSGEILAEARRDGLNSWLGWRYPAHDIPKPAREIFKRIWSRPVPDIHGELAEIVPLLNPDTQQPLDMTYCVLRAPSRMYTEYLANMGIGAAFTLPILIGGELWGLIACHHNTPRRIPYRTRAAGEFLARAASQQVQMLEERQDAAYRARIETTSYSLISRMSVHPEFAAFTRSEPNLISALDAGGAALHFDGDWHTIGTCPNTTQLDALAQWLAGRPELAPEGTGLFATDSLSALFPPAAEYARPASGALAIRFADKPEGLIIWFRQETLQTFTWAGNPNELPEISGPLGPRLTPRKSFEIWRDEVRNRSLPWKKVELEGVLKLRSLIIDVVVSRGAEFDTLRRALDLSRARFDISLDAAQLGAWELDMNTRELWRTSRHDRIFGYDDMLRKWEFSRFVDHVIPADRATQVPLMEAAMAERRSFDLEMRIIDAKGQPRWIWTYGTPINNNGRETFVGLVGDITERRSAESALAESGERTRLAVEAANLGSWDYNLKAGILTWSARCKELFGLPPDAPVDYSVFLAGLHPEDREPTHRIVQDALRPEGNGHYETEYRTIGIRDGKERWIRATGQAFFDPDRTVSHFLGTIQDITDMVRARETLAVRGAELQALVDERTAELKSTIGELEAFSYSISHDMRSPLRAMQGFSQALLEDYSDKLDDEGRDYLQRIERGSKRLDLLIQDVLSYSRVAKSEAPLHPVPLSPLLDEIIQSHDEFREPIATVNVELDPTPVLGHEAFLSQIFSNLLGNAVKFHAAGTRPVISIRSEKIGDVVKIWVCDNGIGIEPIHFDRIFRIFGRVHAEKSYEGTGIGLAIVKKAIDRMSGEIGLESDLGRGSRFWFTLKAAS